MDRRAHPEHVRESGGCLVKAALVSPVLGLFLGYLGWFEMKDPWAWKWLSSPTFELTAPGEFEWSVPPTDWDEARGKPSLELVTGYDWRAMPMQEDCTIRVTVHDSRSGVQEEVTFVGQDLAWGRAFVSGCDVEGGFEVRVAVEEANPKLGMGLLQASGTSRRTAARWTSSGNGHGLAACAAWPWP